MQINDKLVQLSLDIEQVHQSIAGDDEEQNWCQTKGETKMYPREGRGSKQANSQQTLLGKKIVVMKFYLFFNQ